MPPPIPHPPFPSINNTLVLFLLFLFLIPTQISSDDVEGYYEACAPFSCGEFTNISYPFWNTNQPKYCGHPKFKLDCQHQNLTIDINSQNFLIIDMRPISKLLKIARLDLWDGENTCPKEYINVSLDFDFYNYTSNDENYILLYGCDPLPYSYSSLSSEVSQIFTCLIDGESHEVYLVPSTKVVDFNVLGCKNSISVPILKSSITNENILGEGFEVEWSSGVDEENCNTCINSGGRCGNNATENSFMCLCPNGYVENCGLCYPTAEISRDLINGCMNSKQGKTPTPSSYVSSSLPRPNGLVPPSSNGTPSKGLVPPSSYAPHSQESPHHHASTQWNGKRKIILAGSVSVGTTLFLAILIFFFCKKSTTCIIFELLENNHEQVIEAFLETHGAPLQKRYKFSEVKKMTDSFKTKLGQGGFGVVYKGYLHNSSPIAVKILKASKEGGEEFINEVASISRTSHVNVVNLVGFCFEGKKKALIYEFMPNGSLDKFIYNKGPQNTASLSWEMLYQIAKGIARGLEYLHKGCNTRILHFDIKPHNILLDENFCPKISDFGLAKVYPRRDSVISMSILRGTMGYIAPELWNRQYGEVSHKSDVYSYGMMLLEMVGVRTNINSEADQTSEYFPDWIYKQLESCSDLRHDGVKDTKENWRARQMTIVGLWCIQTFPNDRPTSCKVVKMLEGNMNSLEIPPRHVLSSSIRSVAVESSTS